MMRDFTSPAVVAMNLIRYIGDRVSESREPIPRLAGIAGIIGAQGDELANHLIEELEEKGLIRVGTSPKTFGGTAFQGVNLTLDGWEKYEREKLGLFSGNRGFLAMQFDDPALEAFVEEVVKPATKEIGYDLVDMRDVARAGVIDDIMRVQIRDAAFIIADLTHDNSGAYWEAGYAEGLGKPVIYICKQTKFEEESTHFDTNHCTTIPWSEDDGEGFRERLIATLRRSLEDGENVNPDLRLATPVTTDGN